MCDVVTCSQVFIIWYTSSEWLPKPILAILEFILDIGSQTDISKCKRDDDTSLLKNPLMVISILIAITIKSLTRPMT